MQLIDFALLGLAVAAPVAEAPADLRVATTCPSLDGAQVLSTNNNAYRLDCAKWVDSDNVLRIVTTELGYQGCLTACDGTIGCGLSQYVATDVAQTKGSCTLFKAGAPVKQGSSNSWTLATKLDTTPVPDVPAPSLPIPRGDDKFGLIAIRSGSQVQNLGITASKGSLSVGGTQDASCDDYSDSATFYLQDGEAYLYYNYGTPEKVWVDRSGMGQGLSEYILADDETPRNAETKGFYITDDGHLSFDGSGVQACPPPADHADAGWSLWFTSNDKPGFNEGCVSIALRAIKKDNPTSCSYTSSE